MIKSQLRKDTTTLTETVFRVETHFHLARFYLSSPDAYIYCILLFLFWQALQKAWSNSWGNQWKFDSSHRKPWREFQGIKCGARHSKIAFLICGTDLSNALQMQPDYSKWRYFMGKDWNLEQNKAMNLLGSTSVSWVMTRSLDSALTCTWISFTGANMEWEKKGTRLGSQSTKCGLPCEVVWEPKGKQWLGCGFEWSECKLLPLWSSQHEVSKPQRKKSSNSLIFHSCSEKKIMRFDWTDCLVRGWLLLRNMGQPLRHFLWRLKTGIQPCWVDLILCLRLL